MPLSFEHASTSMHLYKTNGFANRKEQGGKIEAVESQEAKIKQIKIIDLEVHFETTEKNNIKNYYQKIIIAVLRETA